MARHKYFDELKKKYKDLDKDLVHPANIISDPKDPRQKTWFLERRRYGFDSRNSWSLNYTFYVWLYENVRMYKDSAEGVINLEYHKFDYKGEILTQLECINRIIEGCELYIVYDDCGWGREDMSDEMKQKIDDVLPIWNLVLPAMWW